LQQLREVWTKNFKSSAAAEDDVQEDDVEMTVEGRASSVGAPEDEDAFEKQMRLNISNDKFSQEGIFDYWAGRLSGHAHVNQTYPDVVRMWRQFHG
jgi:hypothetical protein